MCYEFSLWSRKQRAQDQVRKEAPKPEQVTKESKPQPQPVAEKRQEREKIPA
jgi:hypothetical protein